MYEEFNQQNALRSYANSLLAMWINFVQLGTAYRKMMMQGYLEIDVMIDYLTTLSALWLSLSPFMKGLGDNDKELEKEFMRFEKYGNKPVLLFAEPSKIEPMEGVVRIAMQKLKISALPSG